jgi:aquaporin Z
MSDTQKYLAELIGTFVLVFIGTGSAVVAGKSIGFLGIALAFGIAVLVMVYAIGAISGCHINPAITIAALVNGKIGSKDAVIYIIAQCIGAIIASVLLFAIMSGLPSYNIATDGLGQNGYGIASPGGNNPHLHLPHGLFRSNKQGSTCRICRHCHWSLPCHHPYGRYPDHRDFG